MAAGQKRASSPTAGFRSRLPRQGTGILTTAPGLRLDRPVRRQVQSGDPLGVELIGMGPLVHVQDLQRVEFSIRPARSLNSVLRPRIISRPSGTRWLKA